MTQPTAYAAAIGRKSEKMSFDMIHRGSRGLALDLHGTPPAAVNGLQAFHYHPDGGISWQVSAHSYLAWAER
jgi:hypothetical protein